MITVDTEKELPRNWAYPELGNICGTQGGFAFKSKGYQPQGIPLVRISNIKDEGVHLDTDTVYLDKSFKETASDFLLQKGDILIALSGATTGKYGVFDSDTTALLNQRVGRLRLYSYSTGLPLKYIFYYLGIIKRTILGQAYGAAQPNISTNELARFRIPLAPLAEQKRIVAKIEELFTRLDAGVEALKKVRQELKRYRQAVLKAAFEGKLTADWRAQNKDRLEPASKLLERIAKEREKTAKGNQKKLPPLDTAGLPELPDGWEWTKVHSVCETTSGGTPSRRKPEYYGGDIPWLKSGELNDGIVRSAEETITRHGLENSSAKIFPEGTLLIALYGATVGKLGILGIDAATNQAICAIFTPKQLDDKYLFLYLANYRNKLLNLRIGGAQPNISQQIVRDIPFPITDFKEQHKIVAEIERHFSIADEVEQTIEKSLKEADRLRQSILKRAFEGKLVPQDPADEPAEKLLERIKAERAKLQAKPKIYGHQRANVNNKT